MTPRMGWSGARGEGERRPRARTVNRIAWGLALVVLVSVAALWWFDQGHRWESPNWPIEGAVPVGASIASVAHPRETWVVAINPECPHCRVSLEQVARARRRAHAPVTLEALLVDAPRRPDPAEIATLPADVVRWDAAGAWRARWGHRVYGEVLCFGPDGRLLRALPPVADSTTALPFPPS